MEEAQIVMRLRAGDAAAFDAIYDAYRPRVFGFLARMTGDRPLAEDLLQETFLRLARHAPRLREDTRPLPWLLTVARNLATSHRRWAMLDLSRLSELRRRPGEAVETPFDLAAAGQLERRLERAVLKLPAKHREAFLLAATEGLGPTEIAEVLGVSVDNARQRLSRARAALQDLLQEEDA